MDFNKNIPRPEYPRPQLVREQWVNLNGPWQFEIDSGRSGKERGLIAAEKLKDEIIVPFCPESKLSGVEYKDFMSAVWYKREFTIPLEWSSRRILLHFGACDYKTEVWINGVSAGIHTGGYCSFKFDISKLLVNGKNIITVYAEDDVRSGLQPRGKQSSLFYSNGCDYTRTTGIWQTVWLECVPEEYISSLKYIPDPDNGCVHIEGSVEGKSNGLSIETRAFFEGREIGSSRARVTGQRVALTVNLSEIHLWGPGEPNLYDLEVTLYGDDNIDTVTSYFGMRTVTLSKKAILINGKPVFQRLVLDQGFYPDGIYTAPTDNDLKKDIEISMGLGFNGARMHEKVFEQRYIYWADKLGYLVWGEYANWGLDITTPKGLEVFLPEWMEALERDFNSPAVIGWCPFNETWDKHTGARQDNEVLRLIYNVTKMADKTRPVIDTSGNYHVVTDIFDIHDYEQDTVQFAAKFLPMKNGGEVYNTFPERQEYRGQPYFVSEYGGIWWNPDQKDDKAWGYGDRPNSAEEFIARYEGLTYALLENPNICAFCYTQLYDVEQEVNGLYTYSREAKFDVDIIKKINLKKAAIEL